MCTLPCVAKPLCAFTACSLLRFPKPQVVAYTLLMVPVVYGGAKLLSGPNATSADWSAGVATIIVIPLPVLAFWAYVLWCWHRCLQAAERGTIQRSSSSILRAYGSGLVESESEATSGQHQGQIGSRSPSSHVRRGAATLALLGDGEDNPTLIIRDKKPGEEAFEQFREEDPAEADDEGGSGGRKAAHAAAITAASPAHGAAGPSRPWRGGSGAGAAGERLLNL